MHPDDQPEDNLLPSYTKQGPIRASHDDPSIREGKIGADALSKIYAPELLSVHWIHRVDPPIPRSENNGILENNAPAIDAGTGLETPCSLTGFPIYRVKVLVTLSLIHI